METAQKIFLIIAVVVILLGILLTLMFSSLFETMDFEMDFKEGTQSMGPLKISDWSCELGPGATDTLKVVFINTLDVGVSNIAISAQHAQEQTAEFSLTPCVEDYAPTGGTIDCILNNFDCGADTDEELIHVIGHIVFNTTEPSEDLFFGDAGVWQVFETS